MIEAYCDLLKKWNKSVNLIQQNTAYNIISRHIIDSEQIGILLNKTDEIIDIGSGAGFPGIILAINGFQHITLCEKNIKKITFLRAVKQTLGLNFDICDDIYEFYSNNHTAVSRAFAALNKLCDIMIKSNIKTGLFHKGATHLNEIKEAEKEYSFDYKIIPSITNKKSAIIKVSNIRRKG